MATTKKEIPKVGQGRLLELTENDKHLANDLGLDISRNAKQLIASIIDKTNQSVTLIVETGLELLALKDKCEHGEFIPLVESFGLSKQRASEFMRYARFTSSLPVSQRSKILNLPKKKVLALASADPDTVNELMHIDECLDDLTALNPTQMRKRLHAMETNYENLELENQLLKKKAAQKNAIGPYPDEVELVRMESVNLSSQALLCMDDLQALIDVVAAHDFCGKDFTDQNYTVSATTLFINVNALHARTSKLMFDCKEWLNEGIQDGVEDTPILSDKEALAAFSNRELLVMEHNAAKLSRQQQRADKKKSKRGKSKK